MMSQLNVYSIYDALSEGYGLPIIEYNDATLLRRLKAAYKSPDMTDGLSVFQIGVFDTASGKLDISIGARFVCAISDFFTEQGVTVGNE